MKHKHLSDIIRSYALFLPGLYIAAAALICLVFLGELKGVREGSIIAALAVGSIIKLLNRCFDRLEARSAD